MVSLKTKLSRFTSAGPGSKGARGPDDRGAQKAAPVEEEVSPGGEERMLRLRDALSRMSELGNKSVASQDTQAGVGRAVEEMFESRETDGGLVLVRRIAVRQGYEMGDLRLVSPANVDLGHLALLALDPRVAECDPSKILYLDTETTGLSRGAGTLIFLMGMAWWSDASELVLEQLLLPGPGRERALLEQVVRRVEASELIVTFNGKSFDMPLVNSRLVMNRMPPLPERPHVDLLHIARRVHRHRLTSFRLGAVERTVLGFVREGDVPSDQVSQRYMHYVRTGDASGLERVAIHNEWDVFSMAVLVSLYGSETEALLPVDLASAADALRRGKLLEPAAKAAQLAVDKGGGGVAHRARAYVAKAMGDRDRALEDFERAAEQMSDPAVRLELAKLYEHHVKKLSRALAVVKRGVAEAPAAARHRQARIERKLTHAAVEQSQPTLPWSSESWDNG